MNKSEKIKRSSYLAQLMWWGLTTASILAGLLLIVLFALPFEPAKTIADWFSKDGTLELFTPALHDRLRFAWTAGLVFLSLGWTAIRYRGPVSSALQQWFTRLGEDGQEMLRRAIGGADERRYSWWVLAVTVTAFVLRIVLMSKPMLHDEAYTVTEFAVRSLRTVLTDYHLPNNHILHTILVFGIVRSIGLLPWMVRIPAFLFGVLMVPAGYLAGRSLFNRDAGLLAAGFIAAAPILIQYSNDARGYTMLGLFTLLLFGLAAWLRRTDNLAGWILLGLVSAMGLYTIPIMLYPVGIVFTWLLFVWFAGDYGPSYQKRQFFIRLVSSGALGAALTALGYLPVIYVSGWDSLFGNYMVEPLSMRSFIGNLFPRMGHTWAEWTETLPFAGVALLVAGLGAALIFHRKITGQRIPLPLAALTWMSVLLWVQRVAPQRRFWMWLLPLLLLYAAAGLVQLARLAKREHAGRYAFWAALSGVMLVLVVSIGTANMNFQAFRADPLGDIETITLTFRESLTEEDVVVLGMVDGPSFWYYFLRYGITDRYLFDIKHRPFTNAFVVVDDGIGETLSYVAENRGNFADVLQLDQAQLWLKEGAFQVYRVPHK